MDKREIQRTIQELRYLEGRRNRGMLDDTQARRWAFLIRRLRNAVSSAKTASGDTVEAESTRHSFAAPQGNGNLKTPMSSSDQLTLPPQESDLTSTSALEAGEVVAEFTESVPLDNQVLTALEADLGRIDSVSPSLSIPKQHTLVDPDVVQDKQNDSTNANASPTINVASTPIDEQNPYMKRPSDRLFEGLQERLGERPGIGVLGSAKVPSYTSNLIDIDYFHNSLLRLLGSEVEGREVQLGIVAGPRPKAGTALLPSEPLDVPEILLPQLSEPRVLLPFLRNVVVGRADGTVGQSVLAVSCDGSQVYGIYEIASRNNSFATTDEMYRAFTTDQNYTAIWMKPAYTARIYRAGRHRASVMRLRDGLGWSIRIIDEVEEHLKSAVQVKTGATMSGRVVSHVVQIMSELSERRLGGSLYIVDSDDYFGRMCSSAEPDVPSISRKQEQYGGSPFYNRSQVWLERTISDDGATIMTVDGTLLASRAYFNGPGGRKKSAEFVCCQSHHLIASIVVSQDGPMLIAGGGDDGLEVIQIDATRYS